MSSSMRPLLPIATIVALVLLWELICRLLNIEDYILPSPSLIAATLADTSPMTWINHSAVTLKITVLGFVLALVVSLMLSVIMTYSTLLRSCLLPVLVVVQSTPIVAIAPLLIVILGTGDAPRIAIVFLITFFPIVVSTTTGLLNTPQEYIEFSRSLRGSKYRELLQIRLPHATPYIFSGLRVAITLAVVGTVVAEFVAAESGLGYYIQFSTSFFSIPSAFAGLLILIFISLTLFYLINLVQKCFFSWSLNLHE